VTPFDGTYLWKMTEAPSLELVWSMHTQKMADYGFDRLFYGCTRYRSGDNLGDPDDFVILSNHSAEYTSRYIQDDHYRHAPMVNWARRINGAASWRLIAESAAAGELSAREMEVVAFNKAHQVNAGYTISFASLSPRSKGAVGLAAKPHLSQQDVDEIWGECHQEIIALNNILHLKVLALPYGVRSRLNSRQREVLEWIGDGKSVQDTAILLGLTPATVEKHLRLARQALNVDTTAQAVLKASLHNQMYFSRDVSP